MGKVYFHPLFYFVAFICFLTGHFKNLFYFTIIIFIHELGHALTGIILKFKLKRIEIYPYGGCTKLEYNINVSILKEFLVLIMGPLTQIIFVFIIKNVQSFIPNYFYTYHYLILIFNLLPIYPLDGGRLLQLVLSLFFSYYYSHKYVLYISYFFYFILCYIFIFLDFNLMVLFILFLLGYQLYNELKKANYYYQKFLMERYLYDFPFFRVKNIINIKQIKRGYQHYFIKSGICISEKQVLKEYFSGYLLN